MLTTKTVNIFYICFEHYFIIINIFFKKLLRVLNFHRVPLIFSKYYQDEFRMYSSRLVLTTFANISVVISK